jgi:hypothetical protein
MGGGTGNLRTLRNQSGSNGSRTLGSILASDSGAGAGSIRRTYSYYVKNGLACEFYQNVFGIKCGQSNSKVSMNFAK